MATQRHSADCISWMCPCLLRAHSAIQGVENEGEHGGDLPASQTKPAVVDSRMQQGMGGCSRARVDRWIRSLDAHISNIPGRRPSRNEDPSLTRNKDPSPTTSWMPSRWWRTTKYGVVGGHRMLVPHKPEAAEELALAAPGTGEPQLSDTALRAPRAKFPGTRMGWMSRRRSAHPSGVNGGQGGASRADPLTSTPPSASRTGYGPIHRHLVQVMNPETPVSACRLTQNHQWGKEGAAMYKPALYAASLSMRSNRADQAVADACVVGFCVRVPGGSAGCGSFPPLRESLGFGARVARRSSVFIPGVPPPGEASNERLCRPAIARCKCGRWVLPVGEVSLALTAVPRTSCPGSH